MRIISHILSLSTAALFLSSCYGMGAGEPTQRPRPNMGRYQQPLYQQPEPTQRLPSEDLCRSQMYMGLISQHEGGIVFAALPGRTRVVKPATIEIDRDDFLEDMNPEPPFLEVREYLSGQALYAPSIRPVRRVDGLGPVEQDRLTIELDRYGYVNRLSCR